MLDDSTQQGDGEPSPRKTTRARKTPAEPRRSPARRPKGKEALNPHAKGSNGHNGDHDGPQPPDKGEQIEAGGPPTSREVVFDMTEEWKADLRARAQAQAQQAHGFERVFGPGEHPDYPAHDPDAGSTTPRPALPSAVDVRRKLIEDYELIHVFVGPKGNKQKVPQAVFANYMALLRCHPHFQDRRAAAHCSGGTSTPTGRPMARAS